MCVFRCVLCLLLGLVWCTEALSDDWPQWRGPNRDGVWRESGVIDRFDSAEIKLKWQAEISSGYSGPTVADGLVYVSDRLVEPKEIE